MTRFRYDKLVRDVILEDMIAEGEQPKHRVLDDEEILLELGRKAREEAAELDPSSDIEELKEQLGDIYGVIQAIAQERGLTISDIADASEQKSRKYGVFMGRHFVETVEVPDTSPWFGHLMANPDRYPVVSE
jgi:predicted house-cleaning noncanonical NTP pyrophosphatase (MazG superfamily)